MSYLRKKYIQDSSDSEESDPGTNSDTNLDTNQDTNLKSNVKSNIKPNVKSETTKKTKSIKSDTNVKKKTSKCIQEDYSDLSDDSDRNYNTGNSSKNIIQKNNEEIEDIEDIKESDKSEKSKKNKEKSTLTKQTLIKVEPKEITDEELLKDYNKILKEYWGYDGLKPTQFDIIKKMLINKVDVCAILATGFGKSICYQLPYLISGKCVIVVSPLIALMHEQGQEMEKKKVPVVVFNSESSLKRKNDMKKEILKGNNKLIYMTPEYLIKADDFIKELEEQGNLAFVCIDEAHAVSTWGLDFRPGYTKLGFIREWIPTIPILTLTATASTKVREDIIKILCLNDPISIVGNFDRPNLLIRVEPRQDNIMDNVEHLLKKYENQYIIIYCKTRDETDLLKLKISASGIPCEAYHAGMSDINRTLVQQQFIDGDIKCIIATIAFGMGINIPNVRLVIHYNCPKNMESYYQEIGRAGRDSKPSECVLFYSSKDFKINRYFLQSIDNPVQKIYQEKQIRSIEQYVFSSECRRKLILQNFGQHMEICTNCDNCIKRIKQVPSVAKADYTMEILMVLNILVKINEKFGTGMIINILLGKEKKVKEWMINYSEFGSGIQSGGEELWKSLIRFMINDELIQENQVQKSFYATIGLTPKGVKLRTKLTGKFPDYASLTVAQLSDDNSSYDQLKVMYSKIPIDEKKLTRKTNSKVNKSTKTTKTSKTSNTTNTTKKVQDSVNSNFDLDEELDELIGSSSYRLKKKFNLDSDSE